MPAEIKDEDVTIDRTVPEADQKWRERLVLVASPPSRFVGYLPLHQDIHNKEGFTIKNVLIYFCNIAVQMTEPGKINLSGMPQVLIGYDLMTHLNTVHITGHQHVIFLHDQPEALREWFESRYLDTFDPPRVSRILR